MKMAAKSTKNVLTEIAREHLWIDTLAERKRDALDFHEVGVVAVRKALQAAYDAGRAAADAATDADAGTDADALFDLLRDQLSPEAVASVAAHIQGASTNDPAVDDEVRWLTEKLIGLLGGNAQQARLMEELGL